MNAQQHDVDLLGAHALGALDPGDGRAVRLHLSGCVRCRDEVAGLRGAAAALAAVPAELLLDGPPPGGELLLQRALRAARESTVAAGTEPGAGAGSGTDAGIGAGTAAGSGGNRSPGPRKPRREGPPRRATRAWSRTVLLAGAAVVTAVAIGTAGVAVGRGSLPGSARALPGTALPGPAGVAPSDPLGPARAGSGHDPKTGATVMVGLVAEDGWSRVNAVVAGVPAGQRCRLTVTDRNGRRETAGTWVVSSHAAATGTTMDGSVAIPAGDVASVAVQSETTGQTFVTAAV